MKTTAEPSPLPSRFVAQIGGYMGMSYRVELRDGIITYTWLDEGYRNPRQASVTPTEAQWREFRATLDQLKVWAWIAHYSTTGTCDGTQWMLDIAYADRTLKTSGDNNYPKSTGKPNNHFRPTKTFGRYLDAVQKLIGGRSFY